MSTLLGTQNLYLVLDYIKMLYKFSVRSRVPAETITIATDFYFYFYYNRWLLLTETTVV